jgi:hypothetical protein
MIVIPFLLSKTLRLIKALGKTSLGIITVQFWIGVLAEVARLPCPMGTSRAMATFTPSSYGNFESYAFLETAKRIRSGFVDLTACIRRVLN